MREEESEEIRFSSKRLRRIDIIRFMGNTGFEDVNLEEGIIFCKK